MISSPSTRELHFDKIMHGEDEAVRIAVLSPDFAISLAELANLRQEEEEIDNDWSHKAFTPDEFLRGGRLFHLGIEMRIHFGEDFCPRNNDIHNEENQLLTFFTWLWRAYVHKQQNCPDNEFVVPETGKDYLQLREFLSWQCRRETLCGTKFGLRPSEGTPLHALLCDVGVCLDSQKFSKLVTNKTSLAGKLAAQNMPKNNPSGKKKMKSRSAAAALLAMSSK